MKRGKEGEVREKEEGEGKGEMKMVGEFGLREDENSYWGRKKEGEEIEWWKLKMKGVLEIGDDLKGVRVLEIKNKREEG